MKATQTGWLSRTNKAKHDEPLLRTFAHVNGWRSEGVIAMIGHLVVVGSANADLCFQIDRVPKAGETVSAKSLETFPGGKGANQAAAAAKLGYPTYFLGQVGSDANGEFLMEALLSCGVNVSSVKEVEGPTGTAVVLLQPSGENSIVIVGGANEVPWHLSLSEENLIRMAGAVLLQREIPEAVNQTVAQLASSASVPVILDVGGRDVPLSKSILPHVSILSPNETELARITGKNVSNELEAEIAAKDLLRWGVEQVLVKLGSKGSMLVTRDKTLRQPAWPVAGVVDTTGAGDCFTAAFAVGLLSDMLPEEALNFASAAAAKCIQRKGAMSSLPTRQELDFF